MKIAHGRLSIFERRPPAGVCARHFRRPRLAPPFLLALITALTVAALPSRGGEPAPEALIEAGHWKRARALVAPQVHAHPDDARLNYLMSEIDGAFGDLEAARTLAERAVALSGNDSRYHRQLAEMYGETAQSASLFAKGGWAKKFKAEAEKAASLDPKNLDARFDLLEYDLQAPRLMGGGKDKAAAMASEIAAIDPAEGALAQARIALDARDSTAQEEWYLKAVAANPRDYEALTDLAAFYEGAPSARRDEAARYASRAIDLDSGRAEGYALLASAYAAGRQWDKLELTLAEAARRVPDDLDPYYRAGLTILNSDGTQSADLARAEGYFRRYLSDDPEGGEPTLAHAHWRLGLVLEKEGRKPDALAELRIALRLKPDLGPARKELERLE